MSKINLKYFFVIFILTCCSIVLNAVAQEGAKDSKTSTQQGTSSVLPKLDPRLPPVLPGEEVRIGNKKMKVWSTSGTLSTEGQVPKPNQGANDWTVNPNNPNDISVVIDGREVLPNHQRPGY